MCLIGGPNGFVEKNNEYMLLAYTNTDISTEDRFNRWWNGFQDIEQVGGLTKPIRLFQHPDQRRGMYPTHRYLVVFGFAGDVNRMKATVKAHKVLDDTVLWFYKAIFAQWEKGWDPEATEEHIFMALTNAKEGREEDYHNWYNYHHAKDILAVTCYQSARRFKVVASCGETPFEYMCFYRFVGSPAKMNKTLVEDIQKMGGIPMSDAYEAKDGAWVYSEIEPANQKAMERMIAMRERTEKGMDFYEALKLRRSVYVTKKESTVSDERLTEVIKEVTNTSPSSFNSQSSRVVLLLGEKHEKFWKIVLECLRRVAPAEGFEATEQKINMLSTSYGTILYYEDWNVVKELQETYPLYAENFPTWAEQSSAMLQFQLWTALEIEGMGATLQHYNPIIDADVAREFNIPSSWKLIGQMPFGAVGYNPEPGEHMPIDKKVFIYK